MTTPVAPQKKDNTVYIVAGVLGCMGISCVGVVLAVLLLPMFLVGAARVAAPPPEVVAVPAPAKGRYTVPDSATGEPIEIGANDICCCVATTAEPVFARRTARECIDDKSGMCVPLETCDGL